MEGPEPEELVAQLYEDGMSDDEIRSRLAEFGMSPREIHLVMKKAKEVRDAKKRNVSPSTGEPKAAEAKPSGSNEPERKKKPFLSLPLLGRKRKEAGGEAAKSKTEGGLEHGSTSEKGGTDEMYQAKMKRLRAIKEAISTSMESEETEPSPAPGEAVSGNKASEVEAEVGETINQVQTKTRENMEEETAQKILEGMESLQKDMGEIKQLLDVLRELNIKLIEILEKKG